MWGGVFDWSWCSIWAAISRRACGTVRAGVWIFSPPRFLVEEPRGDQCESLVVVPPQPIADLVVAQARFALAAVEAFFDAVFGFGDASEPLKRGVSGGVREVVVVFESSIR